MLGKPIDHEYSLADLLRRPGVTYDGVCGLRAGACAAPEILAEDDVLLAQIKEQIEARYGVSVETIQADLSNRHAVASVAEGRRYITS